MDSSEAANANSKSVCEPGGDDETKVEDESLVELFSCGICDDVMLDPTTNSCCGKSFCRRCLRQWIRTSVHSAGIPRCPGGCTAKLPFRLPARSLQIRNAIEQLVPRALAQRQREAAEEDLEESEICLGGLKPWQDVVANRDIIFGNRLGVRQGTPGVLVGNFTDGCHVTVRFDEREDGSELCVNVLPEALMAPLPGGFRLAQRVVALYDLMLHDEIGVQLGTGGTVVGRLGEDRLMVLFDARVDSGTTCAEGPVSVSFREVIVQRLLVGGFSIAQRVQSAMDLIVGNRVVVRAGTCGSVLAEFSDTRLTVAFDMMEGGGQGCFNVLPIEIKAWCEPPRDLPTGCRVQAATDLLSMNVVIVRAGTPGVVLGGVDEAHVFVSFSATEEGGSAHVLTVDRLALLKASDPVDPAPTALEDEGQQGDAEPPAEPSAATPAVSRQASAEAGPSRITSVNVAAAQDVEAPLAAPAAPAAAAAQFAD